MLTPLTIAVVAAGLLPGVAPLHDVPPAGQATMADYRFEAPTGLLVFHVHADRADVFAVIMTRLGRELRGSGVPGHREQAAGWRLLRARDAADAAIFVLLLDPVVREADYDPVKLLTELLSAEAQELYEQLRGAVIRVERLDLDLQP